MNIASRHANATHRLILAVTITALLAGGATSSAPTTAAPTTAVPKPPQVGGTAPDFALTALNGTKVTLSAASKQGPVVLVVLRGNPGYHCPFCTMQVGQLMGRAKQFADAKARVLLVYPGPADGLKAHAAEFVQGKDIPKNFDLLLDPDFTFTNLYGLRWDAKSETAYPATFVLSGARKVLFAKVSQGHGDRAPVEDVLAALPK